MKNHPQFKSSMLVMALAFSVNATPALAFDTDEINQSTYETAFKALDADNNGKLSKSEAQKETLFTKKHFKVADTNHNGSLDQAEYTNYRSQAEKKQVKNVVSDSVITSKIKGKLLKDEGLKSLKVSVETQEGIVLLSGFVNTSEQIQQTEKIAFETEGVKSVKNSLILKKPE